MCMYFNAGAETETAFKNLLESPISQMNMKKKHL